MAVVLHSEFYSAEILRVHWDLSRLFRSFFPVWYIFEACVLVEFKFVFVVCRFRFLLYISVVECDMGVK